MSIHSGIFTFDERPIAAADPRDYCERGIILTQGTDGVWPGEQHSPGISRLPCGLAATYDGRIDNRDDLLAGLSLESSGTVPDAQIALAVFERWGIDGLRRIVGDWTLAV